MCEYPDYVKSDIDRSKKGLEIEFCNGPLPTTKNLLKIKSFYKTKFANNYLQDTYQLN